MKAILYIGAVLMTGASVYGFVDYKKSRQKVSALYETKQSYKKPKVDNAIKAKPMAVEKTVPAVRKEEPQKTKEALVPAKVVAEKKSDEPKRPVSSTKKKRKVNYKMYSRAALDERYLEKEIKDEKTSKKENKQ